MITVFKNGHVYTMNREMPYVSAVVIQDDKIVYVGNDKGAKSYENGAKVIDLDGKMLIPGMIDAHCHPMESAIFTSGLMMDASMTREDVLSAIREYVEEHPDNDTYFGMGYPEWVFDECGPRKEDLDAICPNKPMLLISNGIHEAWCNSKVFDTLHIDRNTPDPLPGRSYFRRDENGEPTGHIIENVAQQLITSQLPFFKPEDIVRVYHETFDKYSTLGVTGFVDCGISANLREQCMNYITEFEKNGELKQRICGSIMVEEPEQLETVVEKLEEYRSAYHSDMYNMTTMKIINDGTLESENAAMYEPFSDGANGELTVQPEKLVKACLKAAAAGFDIHIHAIGDRAIHETLMAAKAVREAGYFDTRIINAHTQMTAPEDIPLFAKYNVLANTSSIWHYDAPEAEPALGTWRYHHQFQLQSILKHGARMTLGSDFPADEMGNEPLKGIQMGVTRQIYNDPEAPILESADEKLTIQQCLEAYTINAAYGMHWDDKIGSIEVGKYADLVVLEKDLNEVEVHTIKDVKVLLTLLGGKPTYVNDEFDF